MATDATGTPTTGDSIPTYNTAVDAPSGDGFNAAMAVVQTALTARIPKTLVTTTGDMIYASSANTPARLAVGATSDVLTVAGGIPAWAAPAVAPSNPAGVILMYAAAAAPTGYLLCDGSSVLRADYADLFTAISTTYGAADGTHFNVPDMRGRTPAGYAASGGHSDVATLGNSDGVAAASRRAKHNHTMTQPTISTPGVNITDSGHTHEVRRHDGGTTYSGLTSHIQASANRTQSDSSPYYVVDNGTQLATTGITAALASAPTATNAAAGVGGTASVDAPAYLVVNYIIKT